MPAPDNIGDTPDTSAPLAVGGTTWATFDAQWDRDMFKVDLKAGVTYVFAVAPAPNDYAPVNKATLQLRDEMQHDLADATGANYAGPALEYTPTVSGTYYALVDYNNFQLIFPDTSTYNYQISAAIKQPDALPANIHTPGVLSAGGSVSSRFDAVGDTDWFKFHATAGKHYTFTVPASSPTPTSLQVYGADGLLLADKLYAPFEPMTSGDYFIAVGGNVVRDYTLQSVLVEDDYSANGSSAGKLTPGGQLQGQIDYKYDRDCFQLNVQAGQTYTLTLTSDTLRHNELRFEITDERDYLVNSSDSVPGSTGTSTETLTFTAASSGTYSILVAARYHDADIEQGNYTLHASDALKDDHGDNPASATTFTLDTPVHGVINGSSDLDVFKLAMEAGVTYGLVIHSPSTDAGSSTLRVTNQYGGSAGVLDYLPTGSADYGHYFTPAATGNYYFEVSGRSGMDYQLKASPLPDDYHANAGTSGRLAAGGSATGTLEREGDHDWFALDMTAGMTYRVSLQSAPDNKLFAGYGPLTMNVVDAQGNSLVSTGNIRSPAEAELFYAAARSGTYYVDVGSGYSKTGGYVVQASASNDTGDQPDTATRLASEGAVNGTLESAGERDMYKFAALAGRTYAFYLEHKRNSNAADPQAPDLTLTDANMKPLALDTTPYGGKHLVYTAQTSGDIYLNVSQQLAYPAASYTLSAGLGYIDDCGNTQAEARNLDIGTEFRGWLSYANDIDQFKVRLYPGHSYQFDLQSRDSSGLNPNYHYSLTLYDNAGTRLQSSDSSLGYRVAVDNYYYLVLRADTSDAGATGGYTLKTAALADAPRLLDAPQGAAPLSLNDVVALDFDEKIKVADIHGIKLSDAAGHVVAFDENKLMSLTSSHLALDPLTHLAPGTSYTLDIAAGAITDLAGNPLAGGVQRSFTTVAAVQAGTAGNDVLPGPAGGVAIHGGAGTDMAVYKGNAVNYSIVQRNGHAEIKPVNGTGGTDILDGVERLQFDDKTIALDVDGVGGKAYRLYQAAFNRAPDESGLGYWISNMDKGLSLQATAGYFVASEEFGRRYGANLSDADFVTQLYNNVLHRAPDAAGHAYWLHDLQIGVARGNVLANFSESPENQAALIQVIGNGFSYIPYSV
ncbi:DUF4214 domain-containing protein [Rugamonas aquatica]|uniref:DUF4214 domain-containing protein n=1 Tax=Rugamonas aquatica TaxID=2743357 RepID=A0A6A7NBJ2_9BURK|nr:DUF4214 domain-containing protein [Rugamonas aquatica]MQA42456.1 DUF4214 domain-containing protein [Rugamonas aquatica]